MSKRMLVVLGLAVCLLVGFVAGQSKPAKKFPYLSDALNAPCGLTVFELRCLEGRLRKSDAPIRLTDVFDLIELRADPGADGLVVHANAKLREGAVLPKRNVGASAYPATIEYATRNILYLVQERFGDGKGKDKAFDATAHLVIVLHLDGKAIAVRTQNGDKLD